MKLGIHIAATQPISIVHLIEISLSVTQQRPTEVGYYLYADYLDIARCLKYSSHTSIFENLLYSILHVLDCYYI
jgi:hypothetical protein